MSQSSTVAFHDTLGNTDRKDAWWVAPFLTVLGLSAFGVYSMWAAFQNGHYEWGPYLSPFYSPEIHNSQWTGVPEWLKQISPAFFILWAPLGFRTTCYYYRKAYYRSYFMSPPACSVAGKPPMGISKLPIISWLHSNYIGERFFPFVMQNLHRFFLYVAIIFIGILTYDAIVAYFFEDGFGIGVGSLVLTLNVLLLAAYTFSCHSWRHLVGGSLDCFSCDKMSQHRHGIWKRVSFLNEHHMLWAWLSLFSVWMSDVYVRLCAHGIITDIRLL